jgi:hypothetical protein
MYNMYVCGLSYWLTFPIANEKTRPSAFLALKLNMSLFLLIRVVVA